MAEKNKNNFVVNDKTYVKKPEIHYSYKFQPYVKDLGGSPGKNITQEDRNKRLRHENNVNAVRSVVKGLNNTFGKAISGAAAFYGGGWALNRLLHLNKPSTLGQFFGRYVLPANTADNVSDGVELIFDPSVEGAVDLGSGVVLGRFKDLSKPVRLVGELIGQGANINNMKNGGLIRKMQTAAGGPINYKRWDDAKITSYTIPFIKEKAIKLTNAGRATGAVLSTNLLDSLADNAIRAGVPIRTAIGISTKESTLGNPTDDRSAWNISSKIQKLFNGVYPGTVQHINNGTNLVNGINLINYHKGNIDHEMFNGAQGKSIIQEGLEFYKTHPNKYNPGLKGYQKAVDNRGKEVMNSPEVLKWYREWERSKAQIFRPEPYKINTNIQNTAQEFVSRNKQGGKMNIIEFLKKGSGIHIKKKNRGKFREYCGGEVTDECIRKAKASGNPTLVKRATFADNARHKWKHLEGGIINPSNEIEFYKNWLNSRKDKLYENMGNLGNVDSEIARQLNNISEYTYENTNSDKFIGETDHKNKVVRLTPNALPTTLLHEIIHTAIRRDSPLILKLKQLLSLSLDGIIDYDYLNKKWKENPNSYTKDIKKTTHYEKLNEYIPRLYEFRMENNLDPNKEYKEEEIIPLMLKSNIPSIKEGYYNPKTFTKALNEVAYNSTSNKKLLAKKGGKAFYDGISVLDSNPKMSKAASKKVKKGSEGLKAVIGLVGNWLNSDTGKAISGTLLNGLSTGFQAKQMNDAINEYELASKAKLKKIMNGISTKDYYDQVLLQMNPNENLSLVVLNTRAYALALQDALKKVNEAKDESDLQLNKLKQLASEQNLDNFSNVLGGISLLGSLLNNKPASKVDNGTPSNSYFDNYANAYTKQLFNIKS